MFAIFKTWLGTTFGLAITGAVLLWAALPPLELWPLAWIAPVCWVLLIRRKELSGRRPYRSLWIAGFLFWLAAIHWLRLPHPITYLGWLALAFYLAFYLPVFVGLARVAVHQLRVPVILAAPVVWMGLELARGHLLTGFTMASLGHTQYKWIGLIQISDLAGAYGVGFVVMFVAACIARMLPHGDETPVVWWPLLPGAVLMAATLTYGYFRLSDSAAPNHKEKPVARIALIQGCIDTEVKSDPSKRKEVFDHYWSQTYVAKVEYGEFDLVVWPETMFRNSLISFDPDATTPKNVEKLRHLSDEEFRELLALRAPESPNLIRAMAQDIDAPLLLGVDRFHYAAGGFRVYNAAAMTDHKGDILGYYDKMYLVLLGEYVPWTETFPWLQKLTPLPVSVTAGKRPVSFPLGKIRIAPNICYESVLPHVFRHQILDLRRRKEEPDVLINLTNDGWFWGSSELDMHLVCGVFRAVECRKPLLIAANTGFSAWIDGNGTIMEQGPRREPGTILAKVALDRRGSWYLDHGDWPAGACLAICIVLALFGYASRIRRRASQ